MDSLGRVLPALGIDELFMEMALRLLIAPGVVRLFRFKLDQGHRTVPEAAQFGFCFRRLVGFPGEQFLDLGAQSQRLARRFGFRSDLDRLKLLQRLGQVRLHGLVVPRGVFHHGLSKCAARLGKRGALAQGHELHAGFRLFQYLVRPSRLAIGKQGECLVDMLLGCVYAA